MEDPSRNIRSSFR